MLKKIIRKRKLNTNNFNNLSFNKNLIAYRGPYWKNLNSQTWRFSILRIPERMFNPELHKTSCQERVQYLEKILEKQLQDKAGKIRPNALRCRFQLPY